MTRMPNSVYMGGGGGRVPQIRSTCWGRPHNRKSTVWGSIVGFPHFWLSGRLYMATHQNPVPRVHVPMLSDPEGLDRILDPEGVER